MDGLVQFGSACASVDGEEEGGYLTLCAVRRRGAEGRLRCSSETVGIQEDDCLAWPSPGLKSTQAVVPSSSSVEEEEGRGRVP